MSWSFGLRNWVNWCYWIQGNIFFGLQTLRKVDFLLPSSIKINTNTFPFVFWWCKCISLSPSCWASSNSEVRLYGRHFLLEPLLYRASGFVFCPQCVLCSQSYLVTRIKLKWGFGQPNTWLLVLTLFLNFFPI